MYMYIKQERAAVLVKRWLQRNERQRQRGRGREKMTEYTSVICAHTYVHVLLKRVYMYMYLHSVHTCIEQERAAVLVKRY